MIANCPDCSARWSGHVVEHCASCHLSFAGSISGDTHRTGRHGVTEGLHKRRCLTREELLAKTIKRGVLKGAPWYEVVPNAYGTEIWQRRSRKSEWWND